MKSAIQWRIERVGERKGYILYIYIHREREREKLNVLFSSTHCQGLNREREREKYSHTNFDTLEAALLNAI